jgi:hypothetical protein
VTSPSIDVAIPSVRPGRRSATAIVGEEHQGRHRRRRCGIDLDTVLREERSCGRDVARRGFLRLKLPGSQTGSAVQGAHFFPAARHSRRHRSISTSLPMNWERHEFGRRLSDRHGRFHRAATNFLRPA